MGNRSGGQKSSGIFKNTLFDVQFFILIVLAYGFFIYSEGTARVIWTSSRSDSVQLTSLSWWDPNLVSESRTRVFGWEWFVAESELLIIILIILPTAIHVASYKLGQAFVNVIVIHGLAIALTFIRTIVLGIYWIGPKDKWMTRPLSGNQGLDVHPHFLYIFLGSIGYIFFAISSIVIDTLVFRTGLYDRGSEKNNDSDE